MMKWIRWAVFGLLCLALSLTPAHAAFYPDDSGIVNVRALGAKGDGVADDTAAIRAAILAAQMDQGKVFWPAKIVYFPAGTYRVTDTLDKRDAQKRYLSSMILVGAAANTVRIRLDDAAAGYGNANKPKAVIYTSSSLLGGSPAAGGKDYPGSGEGNDAYNNSIEDITIDVGKGNPGAIGIDYLANNSGVIRNVRLVAGQGSGRIAISMERKWPGALLITDLRIEGFALGITVAHPEYGVTLENIVLMGQSEAAIRNNGNIISMRNVQIVTEKVAIQNLGPEGLIVADNVQVRLNNKSATWVENRGYLTFQTVSLSGQTSMPMPKSGLASAQAGAYFATDRLTKFTAGWRLPLRPFPAPWNPPVAHWANVKAFGARADSGEDATAGIRAALRSGAEVVYFPSGRYLISDIIEIPSSVKRIVGMMSSLAIVPNRAPQFTREAGMLRVATAGEPLTIERLALDNMEKGSQIGIEHSGTRVLVVRDLISGGVEAVRRTASGGPLFLENLCCGVLHFAGPQGVWARQIDSEGSGTRIVNEGAPLVILGLKIEQNTIAIDNRQPGEIEVLGGLLYMIHPPNIAQPAFINADGARLTVAYAESAYRKSAIYPDHVIQAIPNGKRIVYTATWLPVRGMARMMPGATFPQNETTIKGAVK